jgi:hypothetical protein
MEGSSGGIVVDKGQREYVHTVPNTTIHCISSTVPGTVDGQCCGYICGVSVLYIRRLGDDERIMCVAFFVIN